MPNEWVDFKVIKEAVDFQMVLDHYDIKGLTNSGDELRGPCPIHKGGQQGKTFSVNMHKNAFKCFYVGCEARGNVLDFVAAMENCSVRDAALKLQEWFRVGESESSSDSEQRNPTPEVCRGIYEDPSGGRYEVVASAARLDDLQELVVFRELFDEFQFWVAPPETFSQASTNEGSDSARRFTLIKPL